MVFTLMMDAVSSMKIRALLRYIRREGTVTSYGVAKAFGWDRKYAVIIMSKLFYAGIVAEGPWRTVQMDGGEGGFKGYKLSNEFNRFLDNLIKLVASLR